MNRKERDKILGDFRRLIHRPFAPMEEWRCAKPDPDRLLRALRGEYDLTEETKIHIDPKELEP